MEERKMSNIMHGVDEIIRLRARLASAMAENARMREALKPFATVGRLLIRGWGPVGWKDDDPFRSGAAWRDNKGHARTLTYADFTAARAALEPPHD